jgi:hypothetical protein
MRTKNLCVAVAVAAVTLLSGCGSSSPKVSPACQPAHQPDYPATDAALSDADANGTWCVTVGQTFTITLNVPIGQGDTRWEPIAPSDPGVLEPISNGAVSLPRGVTATFFAVRKAGVVTVSSSRPDGSKWQATVVAKPG